MNIFFRDLTHSTIFFRLIKYGKKGVLWNFTKLTWKRLCQSLPFQRLKPATLLKKRLWRRWFPVNFCETAKNTFSFRTPPVADSVICLWGWWNPSIKTKMVLILTRVFSITNSLKVVYILRKMRLSITLGLSSFL